MANAFNATSTRHCDSEHKLQAAALTAKVSGLTREAVARSPQADVVKDNSCHCTRDVFRPHKMLGPEL